MRLNELHDKPGATRPKKRLGRGIGSGLGKTAGRGTKGQKARAGVSIKGFEGGQMPLSRRLPKRGFNNIFALRYNELNLGKVQEAVDAGRLDPKQPVTVAALKAAGLIRRERDGLRLLGNGPLKAKLSFELAGASAGAIKAVEAAGGSVTVLERKTPKKEGKKAERRAKSREKIKARAEAPKTSEAPVKEAKKPAPEEKPKAEEAKAERAKASKPKPTKKDET
jgi:large subunit ribosomal protein L15